ncbi:MAG: DNA polymerase III subunit chi [Gammaproteobacteria bacterium]|nr:DNA polymerase III subunit chi [Rhodocyclaceae bacterium]MBU3910466.1 DNA polymerase III subunit chi [Gammaproteobacteria bacterium]MBU3990422.1 DNA polymerase III subunit chi [Gammaproteobacteria bacterium]MBU4004947.1 DNA polymerase III subunit chi [Gammaproteobacteria bacterium]MBU4020540.1 DNA polymerase III subunit chi [Gammaproteobacteria bacterium]
MTHITFLHSAADRIQSAAQWLQQAWADRQSVLVYVPDADHATRLDRLLWTQPALSFLPHCRIDSPLATETPILLTDQLDGPDLGNCLLNLGNTLPATFSRFEHLVEIVSTEDADRLPARERFKFYRERGYAIDSRDISGGL